MSGNMYGKSNNQMSWMSCVESDNEASETGSQHSDFGGYLCSRSPGLSQRMRYLCTNQLYTDVKFVVNCGIKPKPELRAHKAILAIGSEEFAKMLFGNAPQDTGRSTISEYEIKNVSFDAFKNVVEYLYTDDVFFENNLLVVQTMAAARKFQIQSLVSRCEAYFESMEISEESACSIFQMAIDNKMEGMKTRCSQFIQENTRGVIRSDDFRNSSLSTIRNICKLPRLNLSSEEELFEAVMEWANLQPGSKVSKREVLLPLLRSIHFLGIPAMKFTQIVKKCPDIFTAEEAMHIVMHLANPNQSTLAKLPSWFNKGLSRCFSTPQIERDKAEEIFEIASGAGPVNARRYVHFLSDVSGLEFPESTLENWIQFKDDVCKMPDKQKKKMFMDWCTLIGEYIMDICQQPDALLCINADKASGEFATFLAKYKAMGLCPNPDGVLSKGMPGSMKKIGSPPLG
ncbi:unnamed protein product [Larinioides sclopetarius]|uniref:BTB domain-containing protein n=1 Tax=Larinioides sclopetarius TaxID=280406 RepID=A0AAV2BYE5_9ARAC